MLNGPGNRSLPFAESCERNRDPILAVLREYLPAQGAVLEIGSGTGQHAVYFAAALPALTWQPSDTGAYLSGLRARLAAEAPTNVRPALELDVRGGQWPAHFYNAVFTANTVHFMSESAAAAMFRGIGGVLGVNGVLVVYGPFRYGGDFTTPSNAQFDAWLKATDPERGVRDFEWVSGLAAAQGLQLLADVAMPANNQCLVWCKPAAG